MESLIDKQTITRKTMIRKKQRSTGESFIGVGQK